jgi:type II secretory pathway pseudopilin PulG
MIMVVCVAGTAAAMAIPKVSSVVNHTRVNQAAMLVQTDLERAAAMAARERKPIRLSFAMLQLTVTDRNAGTQLWREALGSKTEYKLSTLSGSPSQVDIFPNGTLSQAITVTLGVTGYSKQVTMSLAGQVRVQ